MEPNEEKSEECSLKIDTIWSEADENLLIKEEIVSDLEPDSIPSFQENNNSCVEHDTDTQPEDEGNCNSHSNGAILPLWQPLKKKVKNRTQRSEEAEMVINHKLSCLHDTKNFKIVKRRLRCGDCRSLVCPECCKVMIPNLQSHFLGSGLGNSGTYLCKLCGIIFHSLCALQAHIRIHTMDTPYVCPDCGLIYNNIYFLILHLLNKCYHVYKIVRYKCKHCTGAYFTPETFVKHIQETHIHCVFRCLYCSSLFNNYDEFNHHMENLHQKQKVQYLNYFRCSLCSNMVIPRFMYQRHIAQHRENSEFYEVDYQCLCGEIHSLIGAFRSHFSYCSKKGILPPRWSFLQRKLKTQDILHFENFQNKEVVIQTLPSCSTKDANYKNLTLIRPGDCSKSDEEKTGMGEVLPKNSFVGTGEVRTNNSISEVIVEDSCDVPNEESKGESKTCDTNLKNVTESALPRDFKAPDFTKQEKADYEESEEPKIIDLGNEPGTDQGEKNSINISKEIITIDDSKSFEEIQNFGGGNESEQTDGDVSKMYDHIPCDHLGYVIKTQGPESAKNPSQANDVVLEKNSSPKNYKIITELDEKTGLITTRTIPVEESEMDEEEEENVFNEDDCEALESLTLNPNQTHANDRIKFKLGNSLSCPFCIVLFPKHNLTFQQFRLHLESYHPDAALNITVHREGETPDKTDVETLENPEINNKIPNCNESGKNDLNDLEVEFPDKQSSEVYNSQNEVISKENQNHQNHDSLLKSSIIKSNGDKKAASAKRLFCDDEKENLAVANKIIKTVNKDVYEVEKLSDESEEEKNEVQVSEENKGKGVSDPLEMNYDVTKSNPDNYEANECSIIENKEQEDNEESNENENNFGGVYEEHLEEEIDDEQYMEESLEKENCFDSNVKKTLSDLEYEGETSKDSNWSVLSAKDPKTYFSEESKAGDKERSRRESEVWSEFYESLMLAEKLKKKKKESPEWENKKKSVVSGYSAKRVVKKPKRYRESSDTGDSNDQSDSDDEFLLRSEITDNFQAEEKGDVEGEISKKQLLLSKLESVDGKFVDYLFDLVSKKEKLFELYKKHSNLRANRYSHDLRSYRKKVLNGIKQRGKPMKLLRYHELLKKKELGGDRFNKEIQSKKRGEYSPESRTNEKRRGRPRKYHDPAKLKERRRSDKEVDFIEKNFEREENDFSPSKRKRKLSSKLQYYRKMSDEKDDFSSGQVISNKPLDSNRKFTCAVCKEVFPGYSELREHIVVHRMEENTYQCLECGECFVVRPSLEKHLHAFHKIKNTDKYITENQCCNIKKEVVEVESEPLKENQCKVCKDQFERAIDLTKHFRIHGMAFLKEFRKEGKPSAEKRTV